MNTTVNPTEYAGQVTWSPAIAILMAVIVCIGAVGNMFIIGAVFLERRLRVRGNAFIINLAIADLIVTAYIMPIGIATSQYKLKPFSDDLCDFNAFIFITTCGVSTQSLMLIAIERYVHVCKLAWYERIFKKQFVAVYILFAWIYTMAWAMQGWTGWTYYEYGHDYYLCLFYGPESMSYDICLSVFGIILPIIVLIFCYVNIFKTVSRSKRAMASYGTKSPAIEAKLRRRQHRDSQFITMLVTIVIVFSICWAPGACVMALSGALGPDGVPPLAYTVTIWVATCNSAMNSIIYGIMNMNFRRGYASIGRKLFCCCCHGDRLQCRSCLPPSREVSSNSNARVPSGETTRSYLSGRKSSEIDTATEFSTLPYDKSKKTSSNNQTPDSHKQVKTKLDYSVDVTNESAAKEGKSANESGVDNPAFANEQLKTNESLPPSVKANWQHFDNNTNVKTNSGQIGPTKDEHNGRKNTKKISPHVKANWLKNEKVVTKNRIETFDVKTAKIINNDKHVHKKSPSTKGNWQKADKFGKVTIEI